MHNANLGSVIVACALAEEIVILTLKLNIRIATQYFALTSVNAVAISVSLTSAVRIKIAQQIQQHRKRNA